MEENLNNQTNENETIADIENSNIPSEENQVLPSLTISTTPEDIEALEIEDRVEDSDEKKEPQPIKEKNNEPKKEEGAPKNKESLEDILLKNIKESPKRNESSSEISEKEKKFSICFVENLIKYFSGSKFDADCTRMSEKFNIPKKQVAKDYISKILGTISNTLDVAIGSVELFATNVVKILSQVLLCGINIICDLARALTRVITFNKTV